MFEEIINEATAATENLITEAGLKSGNILVIGCSTSEICGSKIGTDSNFEVATAVFEAIYKVTKEKGIYIAAQCCEHLNRALIIEEELAKREHLEVVCVVPQKKAGGSFATNAYSHFEHPVAVENIKADAGMDIGLTLIGMHLKSVAVPLRIKPNKIGEALVTFAKTRPKYIGGERAKYE